MTSYADYVNAITQLTTLHEDLARNLTAAQRQRDDQLRETTLRRNQTAERVRQHRSSVNNQYAEARRAVQRLSQPQLLPSPLTPPNRPAGTSTELAGLLEAQREAVQQLRDAADHYQHTAEQAHLAELAQRAQLARRRRLITAAIVAGAVLVVSLILVIAIG